MVWWSQVSCGRRGRSGRSSRDCRHGCITVWGTLNPEPWNPWPFKIAEDDDEPPGPAGADAGAARGASIRTAAEHRPGCSGFRV